MDERSYEQRKKLGRKKEYGCGFLRLNAKLTQAQVAKKVGTTASVISRYERAEYDRYELLTLRKIAKACGSQIDIAIAPSGHAPVVHSRPYVK